MVETRGLVLVNFVVRILIRPEHNVHGDRQNPIEASRGPPWSRVLDRLETMLTDREKSNEPSANATLCVHVRILYAHIYIQRHVLNNCIRRGECSDTHDLVRIAERSKITQTLSQFRSNVRGNDREAFGVVSD